MFSPKLQHKESRIEMYFQNDSRYFLETLQMFNNEFVEVYRTEIQFALLP